MGLRQTHLHDGPERLRVDQRHGDSVADAHGQHHQPEADVQGEIRAGVASAAGWEEDTS